MTIFRQLATCAVLSGTTLLCSFAADLDANRDGLIRLAILSTPLQAGGIDAAAICTDLELIVKASKPGKPARVVHEAVTQNKTLMGWWYHPDSRSARAELLAGQFDHIILAEHEDIIRNYPEFFFEGVRAISQAARKKKTEVALMLLVKPGNSIRDTRVNAVADMVYRVADGCGIDVIPSAFGWQEALSRNRISGDSSVKIRANAFLAAATLYCQLTNSRFPRNALETYWTTKPTAEALVLSAREAIDKARAKRHYAGAFSGTVRIEPHVTKEIYLYSMTPAEDDALRQNLLYVFDAANHNVFWKSPNDWYHFGFDRHAVPFDLVFGDMQQMGFYHDATAYSSTQKAQTNIPPPCATVFVRNPEGDLSGESTLRQMESLLLSGYDFAKNNGLIFIPYQIAWARAQQTDAKLTELAEQTRSNDWLAYMLANMISTVRTGRYQPPTEKPKPRSLNADHPRGYHETCARIGHDTITQLATLSAAANTLLLRSDNYHISTENAGFASIRLLERPSREVRVFCAANIPNVVALSKETLIFTPENFDIEQTVRILPITNTPNVFLTFMANTQSEDKTSDSKNDSRPFLANFNEHEKGSIVLSNRRVAPSNGFTLDFLAEPRPTALICAKVYQHGHMTEEVYLTSLHYTGIPVRIFPTREDYAKGRLDLSVKTFSADKRFNEKTFRFDIELSSDGLPVPDVTISEPISGAVFDCPTFLTASAEVEKGTGAHSLGIFLGSKLLGQTEGASCRAPIEKGPPQSRLGYGEHRIWACATFTNGIVVASAPVVFEVRKPTNDAANDKNQNE